MTQMIAYSDKGIQIPVNTELNGHQVMSILGSLNNYFLRSHYEAVIQNIDGNLIIRIERVEDDKHM